MDTVATYVLYRGPHTPTILHRDLGWMKIKHCAKRYTNSIGGIVLVVEMRSDVGEVYDFEALEDLSPAFAPAAAIEISESVMIHRRDESSEEMRGGLGSQITAFFIKAPQRLSSPQSRVEVFGPDITPSVQEAILNSMAANIGAITESAPFVSTRMTPSTSLITTDILFLLEVKPRISNTSTS
jgi:hypothetical protein